MTARLRAMARGRLPQVAGLLGVVATAVALSMAADCSVQAANLEGMVIGVASGDTLMVMTRENEPVQVRLAGIEAPERDNACGLRARQSLMDLAFRRPVRVEVLDVDRQGRTLGRVYTADLYLNAAQVERGMAWVGKGRRPDALLVDLQIAARVQGKGLWAAPHAAPPGI